jgi:SAM-dependent methyltransferase
VKFPRKHHELRNTQGNSNSEYFGKSELDYAESGLPSYTASIVSELLKGKSLLKAPGAVADFGAGTGQLAEIVRDLTGISPICVEIDSYLIQKLKSKGFRTETSLTSLSSEQINFIYSSNVLEHISEDVNTLIEMNKILFPGGIVSVFVPALPALYSYIDEKVGHYRRYEKSELITKFQKANFEIIEIYYFDALGILAWLFMKYSPIRPTLNSEVSLLMKIYDKWVFPLSRYLDKHGFSQLIGKNIIVIARKS